jgi:hypothetical protein
MISHLFFYQLVLIALVWLCVMLQWAWLSDSTTAGLTPSPPTPPRRKHGREPQPFGGLTTKPHCDACGEANTPHPQAPAAPTPAPRHDARTLPSDRHLAPLLPQSRLCVSGLGRLGQYPGQWPSQWRSLATTAV